MVAPFVGVWIEMCNLINVQYALTVAPFVGVWIEISSMCQYIIFLLSLPSWECGLKYQMH